MDALQWLKDQQLSDLRMHWDDAFKIDHDGTMFTAERRDNHKTLSAMRADDLRDTGWPRYRAESHYWRTCLGPC